MKKAKKEGKAPEGFYKGYDIKLLKKNPQHPDYKLVAEYEASKKE